MLWVWSIAHIKIKNPPPHGEEYINRNGYHSINVQVASWPGSVHDSRIWSNFQICNITRNEFRRSNVIILGNEGYGVVPFRNPHTTAEFANNKLFSM